MIKYVIFDVGGVCYPYSLKPLNDWAVLHSLNKEEFLEHGGVKGFDYNPYMRGDIDFEEFCKAFCKYSGIEYYKGIEIAINTKLHEGVGDFYSETLEVIKELKKDGIRVGLLSNALANLSDTASCLTVKELSFVSFELNCLKPEKEIYQKVLDRLLCKPCEVIFVDDKEKNVKAAQELGINGVKFDKETLRENVFSIIDRQNNRLFIRENKR